MSSFLFLCFFFQKNPQKYVCMYVYFVICLTVQISGTVNKSSEKEDMKPRP